jgi:hypothetical protein
VLEEQLREMNKLKEDQRNNLQGIVVNAQTSLVQQSTIQAAEMLNSLANALQDVGLDNDYKKFRDKASSLSASNSSDPSNVHFAEKDTFDGSGKTSNGSKSSHRLFERLHRRSQVHPKRNSMGSSSPMMGDVENGASPRSPALGGTAPVRQLSSSSVHHAPLVGSPDGASIISSTNSTVDNGPFSGADAAIMADAFRKALRKPDFAGPPLEEGDNGPFSGADAAIMADASRKALRKPDFTGPPVEEGDNGPFSGADAAIMADAFRKALRKPDFAEPPVEEGDNGENQESNHELLSRELAEEGRDIRSVGSSRGVRV